MKAICVIPARLASTRLPKKLLKSINGKLLIQHVYQNASQAKKVQEVIVACDHEDIARAVRAIGGKEIMTSSAHKNGTERLAEVAEKIKADIYVNVQADEPLLHPSIVDDLVSTMEVESSCQMATVCVRLQDKDEYKNPNVVKVIRDHNGEALYFSRAPIPHDRDAREHHFFKHLGVYAYRRDFLLKIPQMKKSNLEMREKLEQLRILENGYRIKVLETAYDSVGVDTEDDLKKVEKLMKSGKGTIAHA